MVAASTFVPLRIIGGLFGTGLLIAAMRRYGRRDISRLNLILTAVVTAGILILAIVPAAFAPIFNRLNFQKGNQRQLIAALVFAVFILFALLLRALSNADRNTRSIRELIEALTIRAFDWTRAEDLPPGERLVVVMPAHNEAENIGAVLAAMPPTVDGLPVSTLVIDDASIDETAQVAAKEGAMVATLPIRRGQGMALRAGYEIALRMGTSVIASLDADGQHDPDELPLVVGPIVRGEADMVVGSRVLGEYQRESHIRHAGVFVLSGLVSLLHGQRVTDVSCGFRATSAETMRRLVLEQDQYSSEVLVEAMRHGARIKEVPITIRARASGASKKPSALRYGWRFTKVIFHTWLR